MGELGCSSSCTGQGVGFPMMWSFILTSQLLLLNFPSCSLTVYFHPGPTCEDRFGHCDGHFCPNFAMASRKKKYGMTVTFSLSCFQWDYFFSFLPVMV